MSGIFYGFLATFPRVFQKNMWPELSYLEVAVKHLNLTHILALKETAPKLSYLKLWIPLEKIPGFVWTFDWDSLPWKTGFIAMKENTETITLDVQGKITSKKIPPMNIFGRNLHLQKASEINLDFSQNRLTSLNYIHFTIDCYRLSEFMHINFNLSQNNFKTVRFLSGFRAVYMRGVKSNVTSPRILYLFYNQLQGHKSDFLRFYELEQLHLSNNTYTVLPYYDLPKSIQYLTNLEKVDISAIKFKCNCSALWMTGCLIKCTAIVQDAETLLRYSDQGHRKDLIDLFHDEHECKVQPPASPVLKYALIGLAFGIVLTIVLGTAIYRYRGYIKVWLYTRFSFHPWDKVKEKPQEKDYDAFVSFCRKDADWVLKTLLPYLEAPKCGFHLCVRDRDFVPGVTITKNIMTAIEYSRRTILVLTPDFIKSGWCDLEFQAAHKRALDDRSNFLIVVVLKNVDDKDLDETLKLDMKTNTYVSVSDKWFWKKMLYAMPKVPIDKLKTSENDTEDNNPEGEPNQQDVRLNDVAEQKDYDIEDVDMDDDHEPLIQLGNDDMLHERYCDENTHENIMIGVDPMEVNGAAARYHDNISDASSSNIDVISSDSDVTTDFTRIKFTSAHRRVITVTLLQNCLLCSRG